MEDFIPKAARFGKLALMKNLIEMGYPQPMEFTLVIETATSASAETLSFTISNLFDATKMLGAIKILNYETAEHDYASTKLLHERYGVPLNESLALRAARAGNIELLQFLDEKGIQISARVASAAFKHLCVDALHWCLSSHGAAALKDSDAAIVLSDLQLQSFLATSSGQKQFYALLQLLEKDFLRMLFVSVGVRYCFSVDIWCFLSSSIELEPDYSSLLCAARWNSILALDTVCYLIKERNCSISIVRLDHIRCDVRQFLLLK